MTIPVICDRCRVAGTAGTGDFSHFGDLLLFEPVKVQHRVNGWDPDAQRAFIALLATTGSKRRAALAIGRLAMTPTPRARAAGTVSSIASWSATLIDVCSVSKLPHSTA